MNEDLKKFHDEFKIALTKDAADKAWAGYKDSDKPYKGLYVQAQMTHSDKIINGRIYFRDKMAGGASSFLKPFKKPVLVHHDDKVDSIGRVIKAAYIPTYEISGFNTDLTPRLREAYFNILRDHYLLKEDWEGTGYILGGLDICGKDPIEKVMDERYLTLSVGFATDSKVCSECGQDWLLEGRCEHTPMEVVNGFPVVHLIGNLFYDEVSFVNIPADKSARVIQVGESDSAIELYTVDSVSDRIAYFKDSVEDITMNAFDEFLSAIKDGKKVPLDELLACTDVKSEDFYSLMPVNEKYKLSEEQFASLDDSAFCCAGRIFPVTDLAHFDALKELLKSFEDSKGKERTVNRLYYKARKLALLPTVPCEFVLAEDKSMDISTKDSLLATYAELKKDESFDSLTEEKKAEFEARMAILNMTFDEMDEALKPKEEEVADEEVAEPTENQEDAVEEPAPVEGGTEGTPTEEPNKGIDINELYTMYENLDEADKEEFNSRIDFGASEIFKLNDMVEELKKQLAEKEVYTDALAEQYNEAQQVIDDLRVALAKAVCDYRSVMSKPTDTKIEKLLARSCDSLLDTFNDLREEMVASFIDGAVEETDKDAEESRRNETEANVEDHRTAYPTELLSYEDFSRFLHKPRSRR